MKNKKTIVDIILPNYNSSQFIVKSVSSVINQNFRKWRLIIIDDNSDKKTKKILKSYLKCEKIKIIWLNKNKGAAYCRNLGIKNSSSEFLAFLDSDDIWHKNKLKKQINFMKKNKIDFTYTNYKTFGLIEKTIIVPKKFTFEKFIKDTSIATSTMMVNRNIIKGINFTNTKICEDYFFKCKILKKINFAHCLNESLTKYRIRRNSLQSSKIRNLYWIWTINKKYNKLNFFQNLNSIISISLNSLKKYGYK